MESSRDLISSARIGNKVAFEKLLQPHLSSAAKLAYAMLLDRTEAEDVVQEAALSAWRRLENVRDGEDFKPWFLGIVANRCRTIRRGSWWSVVRVAITPMTYYPSPEERLVRGADLRSALAALSADQRATILLHFYLDLPLEDVARALEISVPGVKSRINRALKRLRPVLRADEESV